MTYPYSVLAELTYRCPLKCPYCSNPLKLRQYQDELDTETWKRVLDEAAKLGVIQIHFSGGEPLVRRDLEELIAESKQLGLYTHVTTSGVGADEQRLLQLRQAGLDSIQVSIQDANQIDNDFLAGAPSFEKKQRCIAAAQRLGLPIILNVVLHRHNLSRLEEIIQLAVDLDVEKVGLAHVQYTGWAFKNRSALLPTRQQLRDAEQTVEAARSRLGNRPELLHVLPDYFQDYPKPCLQGWGQVYLAVAPDGAVLPCQTAREIPGLEFPNVKEHSLKSIWFDSDVFEKFRGTDWMPEPCRSCDRREIDFGGCRCQAYLMTGDAGATDPVCHLSPDHGLIELAINDSENSTDLLQFRTYER
jgi:pyrroloquinoline quinone biosynthesis protein E